jgi:hypothetical protein
MEKADWECWTILETQFEQIHGPFLFDMDDDDHDDAHRDERIEQRWNVELLQHAKEMDMLPYSLSPSTQQPRSCAKTSAQRKQSKTRRKKKTGKSVSCDMGSDENLVEEKVEDTSTRPHSGIRLSVINEVVNDSTEEDNNIKRNYTNNETIHGKEEASIAGRGLSTPPPPDNDCKGGINSVTSGSLLIDSQLSSDVIKEDGNNNSTPSIHGPTNDNKILIEEKAVDACLGLSSKNRLIFISDDKDDNTDNWVSL